MNKIDYGIEMRALLGGMEQCGDIGMVKQDDNQCLLALVDVLGHGADARKVALQAEEYLMAALNNDLLSVMNGLHDFIKGSRGAVVSLCSFDVATGILRHVGIGNITVRIFGANQPRLVSRDGIVGYGLISPHLYVANLLPGDTLLMHSDGIKEHFDAVECADLLGGTAEDIAFGILNRFGLKNDDSSCIVLKYLR